MKIIKFIALSVCLTSDICADVKNSYARDNALSEDGNFICFVKRGSEGNQVNIVNTHEGGVTIIQVEKGVLPPFFLGNYILVAHPSGALSIYDMVGSKVAFTQINQDDVGVIWDATPSLSEGHFILSALKVSAAGASSKIILFSVTKSETGLVIQRKDELDLPIRAMPVRLADRIAFLEKSDSNYYLKIAADNSFVEFNRSKVEKKAGSDNMKSESR
jgi:hypothetical protein